MRSIIILFALVLIAGACSLFRKDESFILNSPNGAEVLFSDHNDSLTGIIINKPPVKYCDQDHHHPVDKAALRRIDSLKAAGIQDILYYRDWIGTNRFNGYGKLIWSKNEKCYQMQFNFENYDGRYGISSIDTTELSTCDILNFYRENRIDTVTSSPLPSELWTSHAADHFFYTFIKGEEHCFNVSGNNLWEDTTHIKAQLIRKLEIRSADYFHFLDAKQKKGNR